MGDVPIAQRRGEGASPLPSRFVGLTVYHAAGPGDPLKNPLDIIQNLFVRKAYDAKPSSM